MSENIEKQKIPLPCPNGCSKAIEISYYEICSKREAKCGRCGSKYKFGSSEASNLKSAIRDVQRKTDEITKRGEQIEKLSKEIERYSKELEREVKDFERANERLLKSPDIELKN